MPFGLLTAKMKRALTPHVAGAEVWDLGAGDLQRAIQLRVMGARAVVAVDKEYRWKPPKIHDPNIQYIGHYFEDVKPPEGGIDVALVAWPVSTVLPGLLTLLVCCRRVVYLGCNMDGTVCGWPGLYEHLLGREVLDHAAVPENTLAIYGGPCAPRVALAEEWAALHPQRYWSLVEAGRRAVRTGPFRGTPPFDERRIPITPRRGAA